jgi:hypothetical protein
MLKLTNNALNLNRLRTEARRFYIRSKGIRPAIVRHNAFKDRGYSIRQGKRFLIVNLGKTVEYYGDVFHSLYRVTSIPGTLDYTIRPVRKQHKRAK